MSCLGWAEPRSHPPPKGTPSHGEGRGKEKTRKVPRHRRKSQEARGQGGEGPEGFLEEVALSELGTVWPGFQAAGAERLWRGRQYREVRDRRGGGWLVC